MRQVEKFSPEFENSLKERFYNLIMNHFEPDAIDGVWKESFDHNDIIKVMILAYMECYNDNRSGW